MGMEKITEVTDDHCEKLMADQGYIRESVVRGEQSAPGAGNCCAYNQTRERFLCAQVVSGDFHASSLDVHLAALAPGSSTALWLVPFRGISPTSVRIPIDLLYLDRNCVVLDAVESFPISSVSASSAPAASVLALPANTIASADTRPGDQLILCAPEEMKWRLQQLLAAKAQSPAEAIAGSGPEPAARGAVGRVLLFDRSRQKPAVEIPPAEVAPVAPPELPEKLAAPAPALAEPAQKKPKPAKSWLQRFLSPDPPEPRKAQRESLEGVAAYFFTGGESKAHGVRDISPTGFYVFTEERWYPGTIIRMTLTDRRQPTAERSITVNASVVRWGNDGVGLQFVLQDEKNRGRGSSDAMIAGPTKAQIEQFIARLRSGAN
jgi:hypothetical protein